MYYPLEEELVEDDSHNPEFMENDGTYDDYQNRVHVNYDTLEEELTLPMNMNKIGKEHSFAMEWQRSYRHQWNV